MRQSTAMKEHFVQREDVLTLVVFVGERRLVRHAITVRVKNADA
jgi:hypothetical protein